MWRGNAACARSVADPQVLSGSVVPNCKWEGHWEKTVVWEGVRSEGLFCGNTMEISGGNTPASFLGPSFIFSINCTRYMIVAAKKVRPITVCGALLRLTKCKHAAWAESVRTNPPGLGDVWAGQRAPSCCRVSSTCPETRRSEGWECWELCWQLSEGKTGILC